MSDFVKNYKSYLTRMRTSKEPEILTVNGVAEFVLVDAQTFGEMREAWEQDRFIKAVQAGIEAMESSPGKTPTEAFDEIRSTLGL